MYMHVSNWVFFSSFQVALHVMISSTGVAAMPRFTRQATEDISGSEILSIFLGSDSKNDNIVHDINKKEAPRINAEERVQLDHDLVINSSSEHLIPITRNSRSNKHEQFDMKSNSKRNKKGNVNDNDDLEAASSSYYRDNDHIKRELNTNSFGELINSQDESPKIIGVRVTSSVAVGRRINSPQAANPGPLPVITSAADTARKVKSDTPANKFIQDSPTTWRPQHINHDYHRGVPSNRHSVSALPGVVMGANPDYILQQKERELNRKRQETMHPYQRSFSYHGPSKEGQRPRIPSYSYSSVINTFSDPKLTTVNDWSLSTRAESAVTEASAGYVTLINHSEDNVVEINKENVEIEENIKNNLDNVDKTIIPETVNQANTMSSLPIVYSEPSKVYSEPSKVYGEPSKVYGKPEISYSEPSKYYSEPSKVYGEPSKVYGEPSKVYSEPSKVYGEPSKVYSQPATVYPPSIVSEQTELDLASEMKASTQLERESSMGEKNLDGVNRSMNLQENAANQKGESQPMGRVRRPGEQNYEVDETVSVMTNGRTHGVVQEKPQDDGQKVGYVVEGRNFRKYRVEERTADGFIVGEYGVVSHDDGSLRGVRYTADGTTNPRLIYDALMKFLSL